MSQLEDLTERMKTAVGSDSGLGKSLKFDLKGDGFVYIDGGTVTNEDRKADLVLTITMKDLIAMGEGRLDPMTAVMTGALRLSDMGVAMKVQGKMQALFAKLS
ncbi:MAG TPA: SCP2 sterol-binding domain-containing protein [Caulobacteraceae bacterium]|jgi:putative sterol carrier protein